MKLLEDRIHTDGQVLGQDILKIDRFLTHQVDYQLMKEIGKRFAQVYANAGVTKVVTIEASGIAPALYAAESLNVPMIFAKKAKNVTMNDDLLITEVYSFTKKLTSTVQISSKLIEEGDKVLIIDDFLANGCALNGLLDIAQKAGATVEGVGIAVEKGFQRGGELIRQKGIRVESLAIIESMDADSGNIVFKEQ